ncbi:MAG: c-type cytochrome [Acidobacteria bacterium]|nr:c-type cytochrome [Acidobacteriota bacterium]
MKRMSYGIALGILLLAGMPASTQTPTGGGQQAPPAFTNLQVWPKDTSRAVIMQFMNAFDDSLGVTCNYCHVEPGGRFDFASDEKREKRVARQMILLRDSINVVLPAIVGKPAGAGPTSVNGQPGAPVRVLCSSCHRGLPIPRSLADFVTDASANGGAAGLAKYKELRTKYYGGQQFDFTETALLGIAQRSMTAKNADDAIAYLQTNLEYYPKSARTYQAMAQARSAKGDKPGAIKDLEKAVELDPENAQARNQLQQIRGQ